MSNIDALIAHARNRGDALRTLFPNDGDIRDDARLYDTLADALEQSQAELRQERERAENGSCWDDGPQMRTPGGCDPMPPKCELRAGHLGAHRGGGAEWMRNPASFNQVSKERDEAQAALSRAEETIEKVRASARFYIDQPGKGGYYVGQEDAGESLLEILATYGQQT